MKPHSARTRTISGKISHGDLVRLDKAVDRMGWRGRTDAINAAIKLWLPAIEAEYAKVDGKEGDD